MTGREHSANGGPQKRRRSIRLKGYDYALPGAYFVTICTHRHRCILGEIVNSRMVLSDCGHTVAACWREIPAHFAHLELDEWVVMPNHIHGIIVIVDDPRGRGEAFLESNYAEKGTAHGKESLRTDRSSRNASPLLPKPPYPCGPPSCSLGSIVGNFKSVTTRRINRIRKTPGVPVWQRSYYERVIRNERELNAVRQYIRENPARWAEDRENPDR